MATMEDVQNAWKKFVDLAVSTYHIDPDDIPTGRITASVDEGTTKDDVRFMSYYADSK